MRKDFRLIIYSTLFFLIWGIAPLSLHSQETVNPKRVLILHSYHKGMLWADSVTEGIQSVLGEDQLTNVELHYEFMDTKRYIHPNYVNLLHSVYKIKYQNRRFDAIIASDNNAFEFLRRHRNEVFLQTPVIFCGVNYYEPSMITGHSHFTGVVEDFDIKSTLEIAMKFQPETKEIVVINDTSSTGIANRKRVEEITSHFSNVRFRYLENITIHDLLQQVSRLEPGSIILLLTFNQDKNGQTFPYRTIIKLIHDRTKVPLYSVWDFYIGRGIIGGKLISGFNQGKTAAELALRVINGEDADNIPVITKSPNHYMFDYQEMKRFNFSLSDIPPDSVVVNRPVPIYETYKWIIWSVIGLIVLSLTGWIINFLLHRRVRSQYLYSEERYRKLVEASFEGILIHKNMVILDANQRLADMLNIPLTQLIGRNVRDFIAPEDLPEVEDKVKSGYESTLEYRMIRHNGGNFWAETCGKNIRFQKQAARVVAIRDISQEKEKKNRMVRRYEFEQTAANILSRFVGVSDINMVINLSLADLGRFANASRVYVFLYLPDGETMSNTHEWCDKDVSPQIHNLKNLRRADLPWWEAQISSGKILEIEDISQLPPEAEAEKQGLGEQDIKSLAVVPIKSQKTVIGFIGFDNTRSTGKWHEDEVGILRLFAEVLGRIFSNTREIY